MCTPGLEQLCAAELAGLGIHMRRTLRGGVEFSASERELYAANVWCRTATRLVVRTARFTATTLTELTQAAAGVPWERWVAHGTATMIRVSSTSSRLYHTGAVAERLADVVGAATGSGPSPDGSGLLLVARLIHDRVILSIDSSGAPLHRRGWRQEVAKAPLRETLAAAVVMASAWDRRSPLVDPMCGSATIAIEAALLAASMPPGGDRRFAFQDWPSFQPGTWASVTGHAADAVRAGVSKPAPVIVATDRDRGAVAAGVANAARAGVGDRVSIERAALSDLEAPGGPGWLITNPPYGKRAAGAGDLRDLYSRLGDVARARLSGWTVALLVADARLAGHTRLRLHERLRTENGGIPVRLLAGSTS